MRRSTKDLSRRVGALTFLEVMFQPPANSSRQRRGEVEKNLQPPLPVIICCDLVRTRPSTRLLAHRLDHIQIQRNPEARLSHRNVALYPDREEATFLLGDVRPGTNELGAH